MSSSNETVVADVLDDLSRAFIEVADELWKEGRQRRESEQISREEYVRVQTQCRALLRRAVEIIASASQMRLAQVAGSIEQLSGITASLRRLKSRLAQTQKVLEAAFAGVAAVTLTVAAVAAPTPVTIGAAVAGVGDLVTAAIGVLPQPQG